MRTLEADLREAARDGNIEEVRHLLDIGANIDSVDQEGWSPLHWAASLGHKEVVEELLTRGADSDAKNEDGWTCAHIAAYNGYHEVMMIPLNRGADLEIRDKAGWTALHYAVEKGHTHIVKDLLTKGANVRTRTSCQGKSALHLAAMRGHTDIVVELVQRGADLNEHEDDGKTALHLAAAGGHQRVVAELLKRGAELEEEDEDHETPLYIAQEETQYECAQVLQTATNSRYRQALLRACKKGNLREVKNLLGHGGLNVINAKDSVGWTPLHRASYNGHEDIVLELVANGADLDARDVDGHSPYDVAAEEGEEYCAALLQEANVLLSSAA